MMVFFEQSGGKFQFGKNLLKHESPTLNMLSSRIKSFTLSSYFFLTNSNSEEVSSLFNALSINASSCSNTKNDS